MFMPRDAEAVFVQSILRQYQKLFHPFVNLILLANDSGVLEIRNSTRARKNPKTQNSLSMILLA